MTLPYALIGAGPMGLCTARQLSKLQIPFQGFELHSDVGGLWDIDNPHSTMYESAHLISSKQMTELTEFPMSDDVSVFPHHSEIKQYFREYADQFDLRRHFHFGACVESTTPIEPGRWRVTWNAGGQQQEGEFAGVLIANGQLYQPNIPKIEGEFSGELMHSSKYKSPTIFEGKRVLIVGCGNSACDIAVDAAHRAKSVSLAVRRGYYFLPKFVMGKPIDSIGGKIQLPKRIKQLVDGAIVRLLVGKPSQFGLPDPDYRMYESHPVLGTVVLHHIGHGDIEVCRPPKKFNGDEVVMDDGRRQTFDLVMLATGYKLSFPFIERELLNWPGTGQSAAPQFYMNVFHPQRDDLFLMGMIEAAGLGWQARMEQAEMVALYLLGKEKNPQAIEPIKQASRRNDTMTGGMNYLKVDRMAYYVHKETYRKQMAKHLQQLKRDLKIAGV